jgi:DNA-binding transcriptional LysR family regulator
MPRPTNLSLELLQTFVALARVEGDARRAGERLKINQPSMSKRLAQLQHAGRVLRRPWVERRGKTWVLTDEGRRVLPAVEEIVHRYRLLRDHVAGPDRPALTFACGQDAAAGFVREAVRAFRAACPQARFRLSTPRGRARVEGVANGTLDLAAVTYSEAEVHEIARRPLHVEELFVDELVLAAVPGCPGFEEFAALPDRKAPARAVTRFPLLLPEPDSGLRRELDRRFRAAAVREDLQVVLEIGGWPTLLLYVRDGLGVGLLPRSALRRERTGELVVKRLPAALAVPHVVRLMARRRQPGAEGLDLSAEGAKFLQALRQAAGRMRETEPKVRS